MCMCFTTISRGHCRNAASQHTSLLLTRVSFVYLYTHADVQIIRKKTCVGKTGTMALMPLHSLLCFFVRCGWRLYSAAPMTTMLFNAGVNGPAAPDYNIYTHKQLSYSRPIVSACQQATGRHYQCDHDGWNVFRFCAGVRLYPRIIHR